MIFEPIAFTIVMDVIGFMASVRHWFSFATKGLDYSVGGSTYTGRAN